LLGLLGTVRMSEKIEIERTIIRPFEPITNYYYDF